MDEHTKSCSASKVIKTSRVLPPDTNNHGTLFGGKLMSMIDDVASISASRHARTDIVTASMDSVDFLTPIQKDDSVCLESFVTWVGTSSMEVFVKIISENLKTGERKLAATSFLTFVALSQDGKPVTVPKVIPHTQEEIMLHESGAERAKARKKRRENSKQLAKKLDTGMPWG
ncbi:acyl-CoA thioesterase [Bacillus sp. FJAT-27225]|uniref:acyl-CoA thioesterase n=1 Tax=Bacillus sp. FJAT-27225 TaxID=1743144 RepID=UPI00080C2FCB|nr:acyl-CoA thioesterase [Bacillus sp. FJAT-27225]OCA90482.1 acyl-CoA thioesterase [Bacillus sp. FJAT-27225]